MGTVEHMAVMNDILSLHSSPKSTTSLKLQGIKKQIEVSAKSHSFHLRVPKQYYSKRPYKWQLSWTEKGGKNQSKYNVGS